MGKEIILAFVANVIAIVALILLILYIVTDQPFLECSSDGKSFVKTGLVSEVTFFGDCNMIKFDDGSVLYLHGSPNEAYDLYDIEGLLVVGVNYTFSYHHECVMSDGNEVSYHEGNVIDKIKWI